MTESVPLVLLAAVAVVNPPRLSPALRRLPPVPAESTPSRRPGPVAVAALGAAGTAVLLAGLAAGSHRLLDAIHVSPPTLRVAAGLVLILAVVRDLIAGRPGAEPAMAGWGAALVPVAIPFVARPELAVLVASIAAVEGAGAAALALAAIVVVTAVVAAAGGAPTTARALDWSAALLMAVAVVAGVALTVEGVYGV